MITLHTNGSIWIAWMHIYKYIHEINNHQLLSQQRDLGIKVGQIIEMESRTFRQVKRNDNLSPLIPSGIRGSTVAVRRAIRQRKTKRK